MQSAVSQLLSALSQSLGYVIAMGEREECVLEFDGPIEVVLSRAQHPSLLSVRSELTPAGQPIDAMLMRLALALNFTHMPAGCAIALDEARQCLALVATIDADACAPEQFLLMLSGFIELAPQLRQPFESTSQEVAPFFGATGVLA